MKTNTCPEPIQPIRTSRWGRVAWGAAALSLMALAPLTSAQQADRPNREEIAKRLLERFPEADRDGDGELSRQEMQAFRQTRQGDTDRPQMRGDNPDPTHANIAYGDNERHVLDLYLPEDAAGPFPVVVFYHGGGFTKGGKGQVSSRLITGMNEAGIAVAAANYRFVSTDPLPTAMLDGARVIQFLRAHADDYHLDPERFAVTGGSAGAGISLWIAMHDDLADPTSDDPIARQSTRVTCAQVGAAQVSYDPRFWKEIGLEKALEHRPFQRFYGFSESTPYDDPALAAAAESAAPIHFLTKDDPPMRLNYTVGQEVGDDTPMNALIHHPNQGLELQRRCEPLGIECEVYYPGGPRPDESGNAFYIRHLLTP